MSRRAIGDIADFIVTQQLDCEIFNPHNLRFLTFDSKRGLPSLYFEGVDGKKGRIRQAHKEGPLIEFNQDIRGFFPKGVMNERQRRVAAIKGSSLHAKFEKSPSEKNFIFEVDKESRSVCKFFSFDEVSEEEMDKAFKGMELTEYCAKANSIHHSGGVVIGAHESANILVRAVVDLKGCGNGKDVIAAVMSLFQAHHGYDKVAIQNAENRAVVKVDAVSFTGPQLSEHIELSKMSAVAAASGIEVDSSAPCNLAPVEASSADAKLSTEVKEIPRGSVAQHSSYKLRKMFNDRVEGECQIQ